MNYISSKEIKNDVAKAYGRNIVETIPFRQVAAIYRRLIAKEKQNKENAKYHQITIFEYLEGINNEKTNTAYNS